MERGITFGSVLRRDENGLAGKGKISVDENTINVSGRQQTTIIFKVLLWSLTAMMVFNVSVVVYESLFSFSSNQPIQWILFLAIGLAITVTVATVLTRYFGSAPFSFKFRKSDVISLTTKDNVITIKTSAQRNPISFKVLSDQDARDIKNEINMITKSS